MTPEDRNYIEFLERVVVSDARGGVLSLYLFVAVFFVFSVIAYVKHQISDPEDWRPSVLS